MKLTLLLLALTTTLQGQYALWIDLSGEWMLLPACIALWTGHYGWRRLATTFAALSIGMMILSGLTALASRIPGAPPFPTAAMSDATPCQCAGRMAASRVGATAAAPPSSCHETHSVTLISTSPKSRNGEATRASLVPRVQVCGLRGMVGGVYAPPAGVS